MCKVKITSLVIFIEISKYESFKPVLRSARKCLIVCSRPLRFSYSFLVVHGSVVSASMWTARRQPCPKAVVQDHHGKNLIKLIMTLNNTQDCSW